MHLEYWAVVLEFFLTLMLLSPENTQKVALAGCVLHNFLRSQSPSRYAPAQSLDREDANVNLTEGDWITEIKDCFKLISKQCGNNFLMDAKLVRD